MFRKKNASTQLIAAAPRDEIEWSLFVMNCEVKYLQKRKASLTKPELDTLDSLLRRFAWIADKRVVRNRSLVHIIAVWIQRLCFGEMP